MTGSQAPLDPIEILTTASRTAFAARGKPDKDPFLLLTAARLEQMAGVTDVAAPPSIVRALAGSPSIAPDEAGDALLGFEALLAEAKACAGEETGLIAQAAGLLRRRPSVAGRVWRWSGQAEGRSRRIWRLQAPEGARTGVGLAWAGPGGAQLELLSGSPAQTAVCDRGAASFICDAGPGPLVIAVTHPGAVKARFALTFGWPPAPA